MPPAPLYHLRFEPIFKPAIWGGRRLAEMFLGAPADGPIGDSALVVSDGITTAFNMNDARPVDLDVLTNEFGHVDVHLLQYSGAI